MVMKRFASLSSDFHSVRPRLFKESLGNNKPRRRRRRRRRKVEKQKQKRNRRQQLRERERKRKQSSNGTTLFVVLSLKTTRQY
jgi:hypothetical protein